MSCRRPEVTTNPNVLRLRCELESLKQQSATVEAAATLAESNEHVLSGNSGAPQFEKLSGMEQAAGSLGVHPEAWKPIK